MNTGAHPAPRVLVGVQHFRQGWGGTPESVLSFAKYVADRGVGVDALTRDGMYRDVARLPDLPDRAGELANPWSFDLRPYAAVYLAGAWNRIAPLLLAKARRRGLPVVYAPKGGLARADFKRLRDFKKLPYLLLIEAPLVRACDGLLLSSAAECADLIIPVWLRPRVHLVPEPFYAPPAWSSRPAKPVGEALVVGFLAEIAPRKGLLELAHGFRAWRAARPHVPAVLRIAGEPRPSAKAYVEACRAVLREFEANGTVMWLGARRGVARTVFYSDLDLFVVPSRFESYGLTPLEGLAHGVPVACGPRIGVLEWLPDRLATIRLPDLRPDSFVAAFDRMVVARDEIRASAARARTAVLPAAFRAGVTQTFVGALGLSGIAEQLALGVEEDGARRAPGGR